jgi:helicase-like protein/SNF2 domain-containing protein
MHPAQRRYFAEDLVRLRRSDEQRRYSAPQRAARIDANPHQIDAVIFALARIREGGCILADEVGLGKTIEAGLVIAQLRAEGARRILLITPKPLLGQWRQELYDLFGIDAIEAEPRIGTLDGGGVFLIGREAAGSSKGRDALLLTDPFDLCVIDEAHEVFSGIHKRFDKAGDYVEDSPHAQTAGRVRDVLQANHTPVLLLTATPMQNSLLELWALVQYVDPLGTLLGDLPTFRDVFCGVDERHLMPGQEGELRDRLQVVLQRTLRRDAQEFLEKPFVGREARLFTYTMSPAEKTLYDDVTRYVLQPGIRAFHGRHRQLLLLGFHRRMASSTQALAASLDGVAARLRRMIGSAGTDMSDAPDDVQEIVADLEDDSGEAELPEVQDDGANRDIDALNAELQRVEDFIVRARALGSEDSKFRALLQALKFVSERRDDAASRKLVIFTESRVTQTYLRDRLVASRMITENDITLFSGTNDSARAEQALERWYVEAPADGVRPRREIAVRLALVHEFRTRSRVFISTEAGAKGLNLQFCETVVNYDLPWNPQRIEQRIGRCHRYGQQRGVTVINFLATDNLAQTLTFEILSQKLELFGTVLDASDHVLHHASSDGQGEMLASVLGNEFEAELRRIYDRSRTQEEVTEELRALRDRVAEERARFESAHARAASIIQTNFEKQLRRVFRQYKDSIPEALAELDRDLRGVVLSWCQSADVAYERIDADGGELLRLFPSHHLPESLLHGVTVAVGASKDYGSLHLDHPLVIAAVADARTIPYRMSARVVLPAGAPEELRRLAGRRGRMRLTRLSFDGFEHVDLLVPAMVLEDGELLPMEVARSLFSQTMQEANVASDVDDEALQDAVEESLFTIQSDVDAEEAKRFTRAARQADRYVEDRLLVLRKRRRLAEEKLDAARLRRDGATGSETRSDAERALVRIETELAEIDGAIDRLERRDNETYRRYQQHIYGRRYTPPAVESLFDLTLELV